MTTLTAGPLADTARKIGSRWWLLLVAGVLWIILGFVVLRFDQSTVYIVAIVFGIMLLLAGSGEIAKATFTAGGWRVWHVLFAILLIVAAVIAFVNPGGTFEWLALVTGFYFVFVGVYDIVSSLFAISFSPVWWLQLLAGIAELILGFLASSSLSSGIVVLVTYISVVAIFRGVAEIAAAFSVRELTTSAA